MYLYYGSKQFFPTLKKQKAHALPGRPPEEALEAIYLTPDFIFALLSAASPPGTLKIGMNQIDGLGTAERVIYFENSDQFDPDETIYIYFVDPTKIPEDKKIDIDLLQTAVIEDEITPDKVETYKAGYLLKYYHLVDEWD